MYQGTSIDMVGGGMDLSRRDARYPVLVNHTADCKADHKHYLLSWNAKIADVLLHNKRPDAGP